MRELVRAHWSGELPLLTALLGCGVLVPLGLVAAGRLVLNLIPSDTMPLAAACNLLWFAFCACVVTWAAVGAWRSSTRAEQKQRTLARAFIGLGFLSLAPLTLRSAASAQELWELMNGHDPLGSSADIEEHNGKLKLRGTITSETANLFERKLRVSRVRSVVLNSSGGRILAAHRIASLIRKKGLNTEVDGTCASACTLIFLAGSDRFLWPRSRLGFHQATMAGNSRSDDYLSSESLRAEFRAAGISESFVHKAFSTKSNEIWYPTNNELREAGLINWRSLTALLTAIVDVEEGSLPKKIDETTVLQSISSKNHELLFQYTIERNFADFDVSALSSSLRGSLQRHICDNADLADLVSSGAGIRHLYRDKNGLKVANVVINNCYDVVN